MSNLFALKGDNVIDLFEVKIDDYEGFFRFHGSKNFNKNLIFQGNEYVFLPCEMSNLVYDSEGKQNRPTLTLSNANGFVSNILVDNRDLIGKYLLRKKILSKDLDDINFGDSANKNVFGPAGKFVGFISSDKFYIHKKNIENKERVEFELSNILDIEGATLPARKVYNNHCPFEYRGCGCNYGKEKNYAGPDLLLKEGYTLGSSVEGTLESLSIDTKNNLVVWLNNGGLGGVEADPNWGDEEITKYYSFKPTPDTIVPASNSKNGGRFSEFIKPEHSRFARSTKTVHGYFLPENVYYFTLRRGVFQDDSNGNKQFIPSDDVVPTVSAPFTRERILDAFDFETSLWHKNYWPNAAASINQTLATDSQNSHTGFETDYAVFEPFPWINYDQIQRGITQFGDINEYINTVWGHEAGRIMTYRSTFWGDKDKPMERGCIFWNQGRRNNQFGIAPLGSNISHASSCYSESGANFTRLKINNDFSGKDITIICVTEAINVFYPAVMGTWRSPWDLQVYLDDAAVAGGWFANGMCTNDNTFRLGYSGFRRKPDWKYSAASNSDTGVCYYQGEGLKTWGMPTLFNGEGGINRAVVDVIKIPANAGGDVIYYRNGFRWGSIKAKAANDLGSTERKKIGFNQNPHTLSDVIVYEVMVFEEGLSHGDVAKLSKSLMRKYGINVEGQQNWLGDGDDGGDIKIGSEYKSSLSFFADADYSSTFNFIININQQAEGSELTFTIDKKLKFLPGHVVKIFSDQRNYIIAEVLTYNASTGQFSCKVQSKEASQSQNISLWKLQINNPKDVGVMNLGVPMADENNKTFFKEPNTLYYESYNLKELRYKGDYSSKQIYSKGDFVKIEPAINYDFEKSVIHKDNEFPTRFFVCVSDGEIVGVHPLDRKDIWVEDSCSKNLSACVLRHRAQGGAIVEGREVKNTASPSNKDYLEQGFVKKVPFGGFPGTVDYDYRLPS